MLRSGEHSQDADDGDSLRPGSAPPQPLVLAKGGAGRVFFG